MVWDNCNIVLHGSSNGFFFTNDIITGSVVLEFKQERKVEKMYLKVKGTSKASWSRPAPTLPYIKIYSQKKRVLDIAIEVFKELQGTTAQPGIVSCQFHFMLPADIPPTYKDSVAKVNYKIIMRSAKDDKITNKKVTPFTVMNSLNINHVNEYKIPMIYEMKKKIGDSAEFSMAFKTYRGFASKQQIPFEAIITNEKRVKVKKIKVALIRTTNYNVKSGFYKHEKIICKTKYTDLLNIANQSCVFRMEIPQVISSTTDQNDAIVNISYSLQVKVSFRFHLPLYTDIPVTIASTPVSHGIFFK